MSFFFEQDLYQKYLNKTVASTNIEWRSLPTKQIPWHKYKHTAYDNDHYSFRMYKNFPKK